MIARTTANKQAASINEIKQPVDRTMLESWITQLKQNYYDAEDFYRWGLNLNIPKELARLFMPVGHYTRMRAKANLRNWLAFMTLRSAPNAMKEIRVYSEAMGKILAQHFPRTFALFEAERKLSIWRLRVVAASEALLERRNGQRPPDDFEQRLADLLNIVEAKPK